LFIMGVATVAATASCGSDEGTGGGVSGGTVLGDAGEGGGSAAAGRGGSGGRAGSSATAGTAGTGTAGAATGNTTKLGAKCTSDAQCGGKGLICITANSTEYSGGGPQGGICTLPCTASPDGPSPDCTAITPNSECFYFGTKEDQSDAATKSYCLAGCTAGGDETSDPTKCQGRDDFVCADLSSTEVPARFCLAMCQSDALCGTGLYCDKSSGICTKTKPPAGDPVGTACTPPSTNAAGMDVAGSGNCEGVCLRTTDDGVTPVKGVCAELCSGLTGCQYKGTQPGGLCYGLSAELGIFDLGYCLPTCDCSGTCPFPGDGCRAWTPAQQDFVDLLGAPGLCIAATQITDSVELTTCTEGEGGAPGLPPSEAGASGSSN
jgi:hypothetical protein